MTTYFNITEAMTDPDRFVPAELAKAWWKNPLAIGEADTSVPLNLLPTVLLGTINTTSGASVALTGLVLTPFRFLRCTIHGVSFNAGAPALLIQGQIVTAALGLLGSGFYGSALIDLFDGSIQSTTSECAPGGVTALGTVYAGTTTTTQASTTITASASASAFDGGYIRVYGLK